MTGLGTGVGSTASNPGLSRIATGTTAAGFFSLRHPISYFPPSGGGHQTIKAHFKIRVPVSFQSTTEGVFMVVGLVNVLGSVEPSSGFYFYCDHVDGILYAVSRNGTNNFYKPMGLCPVNVFMDLRLTLFKNGVGHAQLNDDPPIVFAASELPTAVLGIQISITKTLGVTSRFIEIDFFKLTLNQLLSP